MDSRQQQATDLCASLNLTLGWRAAEPEVGFIYGGFTGAVVLHPRAVDEIISRIDPPCMSVFTPIVPGIAMGGLDVFLRLLDEDAPGRPQ